MICLIVIEFIIPKRENCTLVLICVYGYSYWWDLGYLYKHKDNSPIFKFIDWNSPSFSRLRTWRKNIDSSSIHQHQIHPLYSPFIPFLPSHLWEKCPNFHFTPTILFLSVIKLPSSSSTPSIKKPGKQNLFIYTQTLSPLSLNLSLTVPFHYPLYILHLYHNNHFYHKKKNKKFDKQTIFFRRKKSL